MDIINTILHDFPFDLDKDPFQHIILKCREFYQADYCSFVTPNYREGRWDIIACQPEKQNTETSVKVEKRCEYWQLQFKDNPEKLWQSIEAGISNVALCKKQHVPIDDVKNTIYQYIEQFKFVRHEIVIPLICDVPLTWKDDSPENVIACIILDYLEEKRYEDAKNRVVQHPEIEKALGEMVYGKVYSKCLTSWDPVISDLATFAEIDFDTKTSIDRLNKTLSKLWPPLKYFSVWFADQKCAIDDPEKNLVRIGAVFIDEELKASYLKIDEKPEYVLKHTDKSSYGNMLRKYSDRFQNIDFTYPRHVFDKEKYVPISPSFRDLLFGSDNKVDFHFVPITENNGAKSFTLQGIIVFIFQFPGDSRLVRKEKLSILARFIFDRVNINMHKKTARLRSDIENKSDKMFRDFDGFIKDIEVFLLNYIPSDAIDIWMLKRGEKSYFKFKGGENHVNNVDQEQKEYVLNACLSERKIRQSHVQHPDYRVLCKNCPVKKHYDSNQPFSWQSCMPLIITGIQGTPRAILFFINRRNPSLENRIQAFSFIDRDTVLDIGRLLGAFLSLHEISGAEKTLRTILPHEFAAPITSLSHKLKDIEKFSARLIATLPSELCDEDMRRLEKKFLDAWLSSDLIAQNQKNYIKFTKRIEKVRPDTFKLYDLIEQVMHLFRGRFNQKKQIYIFIEGFDKGQFVSCNRSMLFSTIHNIFDNAAKYSWRYTVFHVRKLSGEDKNISISFTNYGICIDDDELEKVFDLHYQSRHTQTLSETDSERSHGIGLALSKWYIEKCHGGSLLFLPSIEIAAYNPFFLHTVKNIIPGGNRLFEETYQQDDSMKDAPVGSEINRYFKLREIHDFFDRFKPLGPLGEHFFQYVLETKTYKNELILTIPKKYKG